MFSQGQKGQGRGHLQTREGGGKAEREEEQEGVRGGAGPQVTEVEGRAAVINLTSKCPPPPCYHQADPRLQTIHFKPLTPGMWNSRLLLMLQSPLVPLEMAVKITLRSWKKVQPEDRKLQEVKPRTRDSCSVS